LAYQEDYNKSDIITMIVGNKIDMEEQRTVSKQRGLDYAESKKIAFYEVSAKDGTNIDLIFTRIAEGTPQFMQN
jgi:GTPase SAR1 family protein